MLAAVAALRAPPPCVAAAARGAMAAVARISARRADTMANVEQGISPTKCVLVSIGMGGGATLWVVSCAASEA